MKESKDEFYRYCPREKRSYLEFLTDFNSINLPLDFGLELFGPIKPREFSISCSNLINQNSVNNFDFNFLNSF